MAALILLPAEDPPLPDLSRSWNWEMAILAPGAAKDPAELAKAATAWLTAQVPGTAMSALFSAGQADFSNLPKLDAQDVWYRCVFPAPARGDAGHRLDSLVLEGLASLAQVWLNGAPLLESRNMFVAHACEVGALLRPGNELLIRFASMQEALKQRRPRPRWRTRLVEQQQLRWMRSSLLGRIPGWTPATPAVGPWRPVRLQSARTLVADSIDCRASVQQGCGSLSLGLRLRTVDPGITATTARLRVGSAETAVRLQTLEAGVWRLDGALQLNDIQLWWPHTHGEPVLHRVAVTVETSRGPLHFDLGKTGFREIRLACEGDDFAIFVNGVRIFCRGACWTTADLLKLTASEADTREALLLAREAGMNMLRMSGTMFYEADHFYRLCDELGILIWHDWMFANMDYPADDPEFAASVQDEARQFLRRTQLSPCLALLCGNSEVEQQAAMLGLEASLWRNRLFADILPAVGRELRPDLPYWPSSPAGGVLPFQVDSGAAHYFGVGAYMQPLSDARRCGVRFTSECLAFANVPENETIELIVGEGQSPIHHPAWKSRVPRDSGPGWDFDDVRDHYLQDLFGVDPAKLRYADMDRYLALSRAVTGEVMASAFGEWRRKRSGCAGGIVWFFRDLWPGAGWGVVDATGLPKAAWYYLQRALAPIALFISNEGVNGLALHAVNDEPRELRVRLELTLFRQGEHVVAQGSREISIPPHDAVEVRGDGLLGRFVDTTYTYRFGPAGYDVAHAALRDCASGALLASDFFFPLGRACAPRESLGLQAETSALEDGSYEIKIRCQRFAQSVSIDAPGFRPTHNHFHLAPGGSQCLKLLPRTPESRRLHANVQALNCGQRIQLTPQPRSAAEGNRA